MSGVVERVRRLCLALPEAFELETWDRPTFRVGKGRGKMFCLLTEDLSAVWMKADRAELPALLGQGEPFYVPPYVGTRGWVGMRLGKATDWDEVGELVATSYCLVAPKRLARLVTEPPRLAD